MCWNYAVRLMTIYMMQTAKSDKRLTAQRPKSVVVGLAVLLARKAAHGPVLQSALLFFREWELLLAVLPVVWFLELQGLLLDQSLENELST